MLRLPFIFAAFQTPMENYGKTWIHSQKLMLLFSEMLFLSRSTLFSGYSMKILCVYLDHPYLKNTNAHVQTYVQSVISNKTSKN